MEEFFSDRVLLSLPGCVTIVIFGTQVLKKFFSFHSNYVALGMSVFTAIARILVVGDYDITSILIGILNVLPILWGASGGYDSFMKNKSKKTNQLTLGESSLPTLNIEIIDSTNDSNTICADITANEDTQKITKEEIADDKTQG